MQVWYNPFICPWIIWQGFLSPTWSCNGSQRSKYTVVHVRTTSTQAGNEGVQNVSQRKPPDQILLVTWYFQESKTQCLLLQSNYKFQFELMLSAPYPAIRVIPLFLAKNNALGKIINNKLPRGTIHKTTSLLATPVLFTNNKDSYL